MMFYTIRYNGEMGQHRNVYFTNEKEYTQKEFSELISALEAAYWDDIIQLVKEVSDPNDFIEEHVMIKDWYSQEGIDTSSIQTTEHHLVNNYGFKPFEPIEANVNDEDGEPMRNPYYDEEKAQIHWATEALNKMAEMHKAEEELRRLKNKFQDARRSAGDKFKNPDNSSYDQNDSLPF